MGLRGALRARASGAAAHPFRAPHAPPPALRSRRGSIRRAAVIIRSSSSSTTRSPSPAASTSPRAAGTRASTGIGDARRCDPGFRDYAPFHDVGIALDGAAARALGELARERWRAATGERVPPAQPGADPWPDKLEPDLHDVRAGLARTVPALGDGPGCREVAALYLDAIRAARRTIYLENQYVTSEWLADALAARLREPDGPEVVLVVPKVASGWLEEHTMGVLRARLVRRLREADRYGRLAVVYPALPGGGFVNVHSKVMIVDDALVRIGSANLANRSMGLDTELDVAIEAEGRARRRATRSRGFRDDLLGEHLGCDPDRVRARARRSGSLVGAIRELSGGERTLRELDVDGRRVGGRLAPRGARPRPGAPGVRRPISSRRSCRRCPRRTSRSAASGARSRSRRPCSASPRSSTTGRSRTR